MKKRGVAFDQSDYKTFTGAEGVLSLQTVFSDLNPKKAGGNLSSVFLSGGKIYQYRCDATLPGGQNCREVGTLPLAEQPVYLQANDFNGADLEVVYRGGKRYSVKSASNNGPYTATESKYLHPVLTHAWRYNADGTPAAYLPKFGGGNRYRLVKLELLSRYYSDVLTIAHDYIITAD